MCGIAGVFNTDGRPPDAETLSRMANVIAHRGPDRERFYSKGGVGFAHRHLRIIDLTDAAAQPMTNEDGSLWLIYNGEIYNYLELTPLLEARGHVFHSHSDSEVVLHAYEEWGTDCLSRFNGMFAFALWDTRKEQLFIARDRIGVKPLYYSWQGRTLVFGSEIKVLLAHPGIEAKPHLPAIAQYMNAMYTTGEQTWFSGIKQLLPGHFMLADKSGIKVSKWWDLPAHEDAPGEHPESYYIARTRELLDDSVRLRLRSDVPLGAHLSGGLDSSAIVGLYSRALAGTGQPVRTFSGAFAEGPEYDERKYVRAVVQRYHTDHHEVLPTSADLGSLMDLITWHMDEPAAGPGILLQYKVCELTRRSGVIVINGGQGGDEAWGGYFGYLPAYLRTLARQARSHPALARQLLADSLALVTRPDTRTALLRAFAQGRKGRLEATDSLGPWAGPLFSAGPVHREESEEAGFTGQSDSRTPLARAMYNDLRWYLPALLQVEDRMSMAASLESRAPLLDYRLIEHSVSVPSALKMKNLQMKNVLREAVKDLLPPSVYRRTDKKGMPTPTAIWFRRGLSGWVKDQLESGDLARTGLFSPAYIESALEEHISGQKDRSVDLWKLLSVASWWRVYISGAGQKPEGANPVPAALEPAAEPAPLA